MKTIGKYIVRGLLGRGGMGAVYKVRLPVVNKILALKLMAPHPYLLSLAGEEEIRRRFTAEATVMAALRHPNVVDVLDFDFHDGRPFYTMEYYYQNLGTLLGESDRVEEPCRILGPGRVLHYARQLLLGLSRLHRAGIVHRDIKPFNLLVTDEDRLKICDFGVSKLRGEVPEKPSNLLLGSPYYAAPEQEQDPGNVNERADLYSTGVVVHRMLTGRLPEEGSPRPGEVHPDAAAWDDFVYRALEQDPGKRFANAEAMLVELERLRADQEKRRDAFCGMVRPGVRAVDGGRTPEAPPRSRPLRVKPKEAPEVFACDDLLRPFHSSGPDPALSEDGAVVLDRASGLVWERSGSEDPVSREGAREYVSRLNALRFAGRTTWRLPTVNELFSLLRPVSLERADCLDAVFHRRRWLWSSDRRSFAAAWYVDTELGFAGWGDFSCRYHVRAVCSGP